MLNVQQVQLEIDICTHNSLLKEEKANLFPALRRVAPHIASVELGGAFSIG